MASSVVQGQAYKPLVYLYIVYVKHKKNDKRDPVSWNTKQSVKELASIHMPILASLCM